MLYGGEASEMTQRDVSQGHFWRRLDLVGRSQLGLLAYFRLISRIVADSGPLCNPSTPRASCHVANDQFYHLAGAQIQATSSAGVPRNKKKGGGGGRMCGEESVIVLPPNLCPHLPVRRHLERMPRPGHGGRSTPTG